MTRIPIEKLPGKLFFCITCQAVDGLISATSPLRRLTGANGGVTRIHVPAMTERRLPLTVHTRVGGKSMSWMFAAYLIPSSVLAEKIRGRFRPVARRPGPTLNDPVFPTGPVPLLSWSGSPSSVWVQHQGNIGCYAARGLGHRVP